MNYIDLHVHSTCSDGTFSPEELVNHAIEKELVAFAVTDHDTVLGVKRALAEAERLGNPIKVIPGVELSCEYELPDRKKEIHILGYGIDYDDEHLLKTLEDAANERDNRNRQMCERLANAGYPITYEELMEKFGNNIITRAHFAKLLVANGGVESIDKAFKTCLSPKSEFFVHRKYLTPGEGIELILSTGGIPVLAHPLLYKLSIEELNKLIVDLKDLGIQGIEAIYSRNHGGDEPFVKGLASKYGLFITGGSDFHGSNKPDIEIGVGCGNMRVPETILKNINY
ncbi:PHP domain-containing protein [Eubacterium xylanophilum]|uniref:PHP domain-containing protein n=1 Tax=Eubacterium xylanophilum TaxID=39497 RepID=UPI00047B3186|nr:PHP domain-containing protein [Eubacterium xylanophilum]